MTGENPEVCEHDPRRPTPRTVAAVAATAATLVLVVGVGITRAAGQHHPTQPSPAPSSAGVAKPLTAANARSCGQELPPLPGVGGPPDAGFVRTTAQIHPITVPRFESAARSARWLPGNAPVVVVTVGTLTRAYPLAILQWHEVVDDVIAGQPIAVTYCPLCNSSSVFSRRQQTRRLVLAASGVLLEGALVLGDEGTDLLWSQPTGQPFPDASGRMGPPLTWLPSDLLPLDQAAREHPGLQVLSRDTGFVRDYASSPYGNVAAPHSLPALVTGFVDERLSPKTRVVGVEVGAASYGWQFDELRAARVRQATVGRTPVVAIFRDDVTAIGDAYDLAQAPVVGTAGVYSSRVAGRDLTFVPGRRGTVVDLQTGTVWSSSGLAVSGSLIGHRLVPLRFLDTYWFAWAAFHPGTTVWPVITTSTCRP